MENCCWTWINSVSPHAQFKKKWNRADIGPHSHQSSTSNMTLEDFSNWETWERGAFLRNILPFLSKLFSNIATDHPQVLDKSREQFATYHYIEIQRVWSVCQITLFRGNGHKLFVKAPWVFSCDTRIARENILQTRDKGAQFSLGELLLRSLTAT